MLSSVLASRHKSIYYLFFFSLRTGNFNSRHKKEIIEVPPEEDLPSAFRLRKRGGEAFRLKKSPSQHDAVFAAQEAVQPQQQPAFLQGYAPATPVEVITPPQDDEFRLQRPGSSVSHVSENVGLAGESRANEFRLKRENEFRLRKRDAEEFRLKRDHEFRLKKAAVAAFRLKKDHEFRLKKAAEAFRLKKDAFIPWVVAAAASPEGEGDPQQQQQLEQRVIRNAIRKADSFRLRKKDVAYRLKKAEERPATPEYYR